MHVVQQEASLAEARDRTFHSLFVEIATAGALEPLHNAGLVAFGLQAPDEPGAGIGQALVIEVDRVLRGKHQTETVGARLFQQGQKQLLRRRVCDGRHVAEQLVHVQNGTQARRTLLRPHPGNQLVQQHAHEEHSLCIVKVCNGHY